MDSRSDSLAAELIRRKLFEKYFSWCAEERPAYARRVEWLHTNGVSTSIASVHRLHTKASEALPWRVRAASEGRAAYDKTLSQDIRGEMRQLILDQRFDEILGGVDHDQLMDHAHIDLAEQTLEEKRKSRELKQEALDLAKRKVDMLEAKIKATQKLIDEGKSTDGGISPEKLQKIEQELSLL